jgi:cyclophilin family peptidyl-prolyl cis-trans isomerase
MRLAPSSAVLLSSFVIACLSPESAAQIIPDRTYYGVNRPMPMSVKSPPPPDRPAPLPNDVPGPPAPETPPPSLVIEQLAFGETTPVASSHVLEGRIDLAALFPELWTSRPPRLLYAQLRADGKEAGGPVVLEPMTTPPTATIVNPQTRQAWFIDPATNAPNFDARTQGELLFNSPPLNYTGVRAWVEDYLAVDTDQGRITFRFRPDQAPATVANIRELVAGGFYTDTIIHRVVNRLPTTGHPFVIQFGDPGGTGEGGHGRHVDLERSQLPHDFGVLSMARDDHPDTGGSQVFICLSREGTARLDGKYTAFAQAVDGADVILRLAAVRTDATTQRPVTPPRVLGASLIPAEPCGAAPRPVTRPAAAGR